jgi:VanZ family protein
VRALLRFGPPIVWMGFIAVLSGSLFGADRTGAWLLPVLGRLLPGASPTVLQGLHAVIRKIGHLVEYAILAALWRRALVEGRAPARAGARAFALSALYAVADEARQGLAPNRTPSALDVLIDTVGALVAVICLEAGGAAIRTAMRLARWAAAAVALGSLAAAVLDWSLGLDTADLLMAALGAGAAAWGLGHAAAQPRDPT